MSRPHRVDLAGDRTRDRRTVTSAASTEPGKASRRRGLQLVCLTGVLWGTIGPGVHLVHGRSGFSPLTIGAYRSLAGIVTLLVAAAATGRLGPCLQLLKERQRDVLGAGVLTAAFQLLFFVAVLEVGVSVATVLGLGVAPVLLLVLESVRRRRAPARGQLATVALAVLGLALLSGTGASSPAAPAPVLGVLAALASGAAYAFSAEFAAGLSRDHDPLTVTTTTMSVVAAVLVPGGLIAARVRGEPTTTGDTGTWLLLVYLGVVTMALAYVVLCAGLRTTPSGTAVVATLLEPVTAVAIAVLFLGEALTPAGLIGSVLVVGAIAGLGITTAEPPEPQPQ